MKDFAEEFEKALRDGFARHFEERDIGFVFILIEAQSGKGLARELRKYVDDMQTAAVLIRRSTDDLKALLRDLKTGFNQAHTPLASAKALIESFEFSPRNEPVYRPYQQRSYKPAPGSRADRYSRPKK